MSADLDSAFEWYEEQKPGLGRRFLASVNDSFDNIAEFPEIYALRWKNLRSCRIAVFPYLILFRILDAEIEVIAVVHGHRDESVWKSRA